jgi:TPR repeat protein
MRQAKDINTLLALAEQGDTKAMIQIGPRYYYGFGGVEQNYEEAVRWFKLAGNNRMLGKCFFYGYGVEQNYDEAVKCFSEADDKEMLGECYLHGLGVERDVNKTIELWESACEENWRYYDVMLKLAHLYGDGIEMEPDYENALKWWRQLAENDSGEFGEEGAFSEAMYQLACYYYEGKGVEKNTKFALKCFKHTIDLYRQESCIQDNEGDDPDFIIHARKLLAEHN